MVWYWVSSLSHNSYSHEVLSHDLTDALEDILLCLQYLMPLSFFPDQGEELNSSWKLKRTIFHLIHRANSEGSWIPGNLKNRCSLLCCLANHTVAKVFLSFSVGTNNKTAQTLPLFLPDWTAWLLYNTKSPDRLEWEHIRISCQIISRGHDCSRWLWAVVQFRKEKKKKRETNRLPGSKNS